MGNFLSDCKVICLSLGYRGDIVDDLTQEIAIKLWEKDLENADIGLKYYIAKLAICDYYRSQYGRHQPKNKLVHMPDYFFEQVGTEELEFDALDIDKKVKDPLVLMYLQGYTLKEIGQTFGYTESRASQILKEFKANL